MHTPSTLERAFELAKSGTCETINDIRLKLKAEHHDQVDAHLAGPAIKRQLTQLCERSRDAAAA